MKITISLSFILILLFSGYSFAQNNVTPQVITPISSTIYESSGLINLDGHLWTHNDSGGQTALYEISKMDGSVLRTVIILNAANVDWEDLASDSEYVFIGDFGNNSGSRTDLKIYRISRNDLETNDSVAAEIINFSYSDQTSWDPNPNQTDFDCEAFVAFNDSLYLFSKDWVDRKTRMYQLSREPGTYVAQYRETFDAGGLITAAEMFSPGVLALQGYSTLLSPFTLLFQQFTGTGFFQGENLKLNWTIKAQTEGIAFADTNGVYVTSEKAPSPLPYPANLYYLDISGFLLDPPPTGFQIILPRVKICHSDHMFTISAEDENLILKTISITNVVGQLIKQVNRIMGTRITIPIDFQPGIYLVTVETDRGTVSRKILLD